MPYPREIAVADHAITQLLRIHRVFADAHAKRGGAAHRLFHHLVIGNIRAVIGEERSARLGKRFELCDLMPEPSFGDASRGEKKWWSGGVGEWGSLGELIGDGFGRVAGWSRIGHRDDRGKSAAPRRLKARRSRLRRWNARVAEMDMDVNEARECQCLVH